MRSPPTIILSVIAMCEQLAMYYQPGRLLTTYRLRESWLLRISQNPESKLRSLRSTRSTADGAYQLSLLAAAVPAGSYQCYLDSASGIRGPKRTTPPQFEAQVDCVRKSRSILQHKLQPPRGEILLWIFFFLFDFFWSP